MAVVSEPVDGRRGRGMARAVGLLTWGLAALVSAATASAAELKVLPAQVVLDQPEGSQQLLITVADGPLTRDATRRARFEVRPAGIARVDAEGLVQPLTEGTGEIIIQVDQLEHRVPLSVTGLLNPTPVSFASDVQPLLAKARCNSGGCHGKAEGQNGFKLSLLGFDDAFDYDAIVKQGRGRRVSLADPDGSLLLRKAAAITPHGGGLKIEPDSPGFRRLRRWIASGAAPTTDAERPIVRIEVEPAQIRLAAGEQRQLQVTAFDAEGHRRCATVEADYLSNAAHLVSVSPRGLLEAGTIAGDAAILVRYLGHVAVCRVVLPRPSTVVTRPPEVNFVDRLVWDKLTELGIPPSDLSDDATFLRRVSLDLLGTLPTATEARQFLANPSPDKRRQLIDQLLARPEYAEYWAMKWANLLRADKIKVTPQGTVGMSRWLRKQFLANRPYDEMVREILTVQGPVQSESPAAFFKALDQPEVASRSVSQLFLGVRIECAQCHHHPSERWGQDDYAALAGFFTGLSVKRLPNGGEAIVARRGTDVKHPRTGELVPARALGAAPADFQTVADRRQSLADWVTQPDNPFFAKAIANRLWAHYLGRGLVEPIDDLRATNPASNEPLLDALANHLRETRYDLKAFTRTLLNSRVYQLSSSTNDVNRDDRQHFSHATPKALPAEILLDALSQTTGVPEKFPGWPDGVRATQVWDNRMPSYFFKIFGRPVRATVCECERSNEPSITQALHLLNSPEMQSKIGQRDGRARRLSETALTPDELLDEIYLGSLSRFPTAEERSVLREAFADGDRRQAVEDALWAVLNTKEFLYNH